MKKNTLEYSMFSFTRYTVLRHQNINIRFFWFSDMNHIFMVGDKNGHFWTKKKMDCSTRHKKNNGKNKSSIPPVHQQKCDSNFGIEVREQQFLQKFWENVFPRE